MPDSRRALYRIVYPITERPMVRIGGADFPVIDLSEMGLRYELGRSGVPELGSKVRGALAMRRGGEVSVGGEVIQLREGAIVLRLDPPGIPFGEVIAEQRHLRSKGFTLGER
jgi:hypothetical protein